MLNGNIHCPHTQMVKGIKGPEKPKTSFGLLSGAG